MRKLLFVLGFLSLATFAFCWEGSDMTVTLLYPKGSGATTYMSIPTSAYGIVKNGTSAVDFHNVELYDTVLGETVTLRVVEDMNVSTETKLMKETLIKWGRPAISSQYPIRWNDTYVKATSKYSTSWWPYFATDPTKSLIGGGTNSAWLSPDGINTNQRFHIDLGTAKIVTRIYYENYHNSGLNTDLGVKNFIFQGSNTDADFADTTYLNDGTWDNLTTDTTVMAKHIVANTPDPKFINVTNSVAYRYYALKFADNYGGTTYGMCIRRIELQTNFKVVFGRKYIMTLRGKDIVGDGKSDWGYVYFLPRLEE